MSGRVAHIPFDKQSVLLSHVRLPSFEHRITLYSLYFSAVGKTAAIAL
jgi:hypothetical protein